MAKKITFAIVAFVLLLVVLETAARGLEAFLFRQKADQTKPGGWQAEFFSSFFDWHEPDPVLLWRFRANLDNPLIKTNADGLLGRQVPREKAPQTIRILLLGDSSPVGLGLTDRRQAFGEQLRDILERQYLGVKNIELVNAAVSGYTSEQIQRWLQRHGWTWHPDLVLLYCGNNDASISGTVTDRDLMATQQLPEIRKFASHSALYRTLRRLIKPSPRTPSDTAGTLTVRVTPRQYAENLERIADQCREHHCPLVILKPPVPVLWPAGLQFRLFRHISGEDGQLIFPPFMAEVLGRPIKYCISEKRFHEFYGEGDIFTREVFNSAYRDSLPSERAVSHYIDLLDGHENDPVLLNNLGVSYWEERNYRNADLYLRVARERYVTRHAERDNDGIIAAGSPFLYNIGINLIGRDSVGPDALSDSTSPVMIYLDSALQADFFSLRIKRSYWAIIDSMQSQKNISVVDLPALFKTNGGERLFIDHCHPTPEGHRLIAQALAECIKIEGLLR